MKNIYILTIVLCLFSCTNENEKVEIKKPNLASKQINSNNTSVKNDFIWDKDLDSSLTIERASLAKDIVNAHKNNDTRLGTTRLHTDILNNPICLADWNKRFLSKNIFNEQFAVKFIEANETAPLTLIIRTKVIGREKFGRIKFKPIVSENNKLVINAKCKNN